jgi:hypothetical protein
VIAIALKTEEQDAIWNNDQTIISISTIHLTIKKNQNEWRTSNLTQQKFISLQWPLSGLYSA